MNEFIKLPDTKKAEYFNNTALKARLPNVAIEKDWWVTTVLRALFALPIV